MATWTTARRPVAGLALHRCLAVDGRQRRQGIPNGKPSTSGASRSTKNSRPVGSCVARGGDTNARLVYAIQKYLDWMKAYAPAAAQGMTFFGLGPVTIAGRGRPADVHLYGLHRRLREGRPVVNEDGTPKCVFPEARTALLEGRMKLGYQDRGSWTLLKSTPER